MVILQKFHHVEEIHDWKEYHYKQTYYRPHGSFSNPKPILAAP
jgi:hypothetical protein